MLDILIKSGQVIDGAGNPWFRADLAIRGDKIVQIRPNIANQAKQVIDATGLIVAPGFIDTHTHSDVRVFKHPEEDAKLMQGITTALIGQDGLSVAHLDGYLDEFTFRFNRRTSRSRGKLFYRLVQQAAAIDPVFAKQIRGGTLDS